MRQVAVGRKRVVIVDDSLTIQALLEHILSARLNYEVVGIAADGASAFPMIRRLQPDLVTIDLTMPSVDGRQLLKELEVYPAMCKVVVSAAACEDLAMRASLESAGADGCIDKKDLSRDAGEFCRVLSSIVRSPKKVKRVSAARPAAVSGPLTAYPIPVDERERLAALAALGLTNGHADHQLDLLTEHLVATTNFSACIATFIDRETQWVRSGYGLQRGSMARSQAICNYTICGDEPLIVHDTRADSRFAGLDVVVGGPMIRSYVGSPIIGASGVRLGAMCLLDTKPRRVTVKELANLRSIARIAADMVESRAPLHRKAA